jgi:hypothetical protein
MDRATSVGCVFQARIRDLRAKRRGRGCRDGLQLSLVAALLSASAAANAGHCDVLPWPGELDAIAVPSFLGNYIAEDGNQLFFSARRRGAPEMAFEVYRYAPGSRQLTQLTQDTPVVTVSDPSNFADFAPPLVTATSADGRYVFVSYQFRTRGGGTAPGSPPFQLLTRSELSFRLDTQTGQRLPISSPLTDAAIADGISFGSTVISASFDGSRAVISDCVASTTSCPGDTFIVDFEGGAPISGQSLLFAASGHDFPIPSINSFPISGDGTHVIFGSTRNLLAAPGTIWQNTPGNTFGLALQSYRIELDTLAIDEVVDINIAAAPGPTQERFNFVRTFGRTFQTVAVDRRVPYAGIDNPLYENFIGFAGPDRQVMPIVPPGNGSRGLFATARSIMAPNEDRVYFIADQDLVGSNPTGTPQAYSYDLETAEFRQLSQFDDGRSRLAGLGLGSLVDVGNLSGSAQIEAMSADHTLVLVTQSFGDDRARRIQSTFAAGGRRTLINTRATDPLPRGISHGVFRPEELPLLSCPN